MLAVRVLGPMPMSDPKSTDGVWRRDEIESPCIKTCVIHPETRLCVGCARSIDEISAWSRMSPEERRRIMEELPARSASPGRRSGGRAGRAARRSGGGGDSGGAS